MKLRIKGNSLRIRLTKTEINKLAETGYLEEQTIFPNNRFVYALQSVADAPELFATFLNNKMQLFNGNWFFSMAAPIILSNAVCLPTSSRSMINFPLASNKALA